MLQRVQLLLDSQTKKELKKIAELENRSMSDLAREILVKSVQKRGKGAKDGGIAFLKQQAKKAVKGPGNSEYDRYAYDL
ncbi:MAG: hypothetical protein A3D24_03915 [Candidatus Blackburnbacteria bacterium RIFCSPHIGHO2_02_FULL_39_13]|uniref:Uncharacterized protein n=1 Tax=Candidatus Blackburnbacteria bacterium RIFCSPLOWO2_01_FULL_40_20 TaxID=1797519 RepID=A0A1G1VD10_9BACT|nr:MAG: hypothetical protein UT38_C0011G0002 [Microgenomates group bacterium GW2011_GWA2_39_19]OGY07024.1 MAG: hypothetical protein A2694_03880 [Candidatus Blackburnbacteria bacterium RIFCSPHIGHO2_01_FULL_40_17]OGY08537.1 MAG: hypothetical protein A3D24_03915 [Candidatus Blackburnbacteria bacterium RIFCSPHIGHO2_02_FULL_39_13]OGY13304.1 MAG: hypothetical protein A3A77_02650 [Candidatus Blackburnbacteria bacterium RIFCSPLOWO2_01_FULL_40_20]OGY14480.1 MAG: hypothetical protein A3I52_01665 [Candida